MRDYIHVVDLAQGHVAALNQLKKKCGCKASYTCILVFVVMTMVLILNEILVLWGKIVHSW